MESGVKIYNVQPLIEKVHFGDIGSIAIAEMLWRTNIIAVVAGGTRPVYADNAVLIYDNTSKKFLFEITCTSSIKAVRFRKDRYGFCFTIFLIFVKIKNFKNTDSIV